MSTQSLPSPNAGIAWDCATEEGELGAAKTILLVEDELFVRAVTCEVLRSEGYRVFSAKNAVEATQIFEANFGAIELLLTDVLLPGDTGILLAERLRREDPSLRVLFVTGYAQFLNQFAEEQEECLPKPYSKTMLLERLRSMFDQKKIWNESRVELTPACGNG